MGVAAVQTNANQMIGRPGNVTVAGCAEASLDFDCVSCVKGFSPRTDTSNPKARGRGWPRCVRVASLRLSPSTGRPAAARLAARACRRRCLQHGWPGTPLTAPPLPPRHLQRIVQCVANAAGNVGAAAGSGCNMALPYMQYCRKVRPLWPAQRSTQHAAHGPPCRRCCASWLPPGLAGTWP